MMAEEEKVDEESFEFPLTDLAFVVEGKRLYVSKDVMKQHSLVFKTMLEGNFKEKDASEIELPGKSFEDFKEFLRSFYPNMEHPLNRSNVLQVYPLANEYQMPKLKEKCEKLLFEQINVSGNRFSGISSGTLLKYMCLAEKYALEKLIDAGVFHAAHITLSALKSQENKDKYAILSQETRLRIAEQRVRLLEESVGRYCSNLLRT